jgi:hypothetical protein
MHLCPLCLLYDEKLNWWSGKTMAIGHESLSLPYKLNSDLDYTSGMGNRGVRVHQNATGTHARDRLLAVSRHSRRVRVFWLYHQVSVSFLYFISLFHFSILFLYFISLFHYSISSLHFFIFRCVSSWTGTDTGKNLAWIYKPYKTRCDVTSKWFYPFNNSHWASSFILYSLIKYGHIKNGRQRYLIEYSMTMSLNKCIRLVMMTLQSVENDLITRYGAPSSWKWAAEQWYHYQWEPANYLVLWQSSNRVALAPSR